jgi:hypothetical protein
MCPTKQLVEQQVKSQPKPQVEQKEKPQVQDKINHEDIDLGMNKKIRRGGRANARHPKLDQDAKIVSKNQDEKKDYAHIKCFKCEDMGHFASRYPTKLEKKAQATHERQGNGKHHTSKEEKAQSKRKCHSCRERTHG